MNTKQILQADWARLAELSGAPVTKLGWKNCFSPRFASIYIMRKASGTYSANYPRLAKCWSLLNFLVFNAEIPASLSVGPGFVMPHPQGVILGAGAIGSNVTVMQQVTFGAKTLDFGFDPSQRPNVGNNVTVSAGAKVIGAVTLNEDCVVGANAVVLEDVPAGSLAVGVPARIVTRNAQPSVDHTA